MTQPINLIFRFLQSRQPVQIWLYENTDLRIEGRIIVRRGWEAEWTAWREAWACAAPAAGALVGGGPRSGLRRRADGDDRPQARKPTTPSPLPPGL